MIPITIFARTKNPTLAGGPVAQRDLQRYGNVEVEFTITKYTIGVAVAGFSSDWTYYRNPKTEKQKLSNQRFIERYVDKCENPIKLRSDLGI